jgi:hypothetical protein
MGWNFRTPEVAASDVVGSRHLPTYADQSTGLADVGLSNNEHLRRGCQMC